VTTELERAYEYCRRTTRSQAKNFYFAFRTLPGYKRRAIYATYAFCRICDDIADGDRPDEEKRRLLLETRKLLHQSPDVRAAHPVFMALRDAADAFKIPEHYFEEVINGVEMDLGRTRFENFQELQVYCHKVASIVGLISIEVFGYEDPRAKQYAIDLGLAMQLTNILRDIHEDSGRGRIYIPLDEISRFGYSEGELQDGVVNDAFRDLMRFQVKRARRYFDSGRRLIPLLSQRSRACPAVLLAVYSAILDRIESSGYDVFQERIGLSTTKKLMLMARLWAASLIPAHQPRG
jgi:phytoene synthase